MGPFCPGQDQQGQGFRYGLIGVYTVPVDGEGAPLPEGLSELRLKCGHHSKDEELDDECLEAGEQEEGQDGRADQLLQEEADRRKMRFLKLWYVSKRYWRRNGRSSSRIEDQCQFETSLSGYQFGLGKRGRC